MKQNTPRYLSSLNALRFFSAFFVVIYHYGKNTFPFNTEPLSVLVKYGATIVSFFFFLSGVVLCYSHLERKTDKSVFYWKRIKRIFPVYFICFFLSLFLAMFFYQSYPKGFSVLLQGLGLHSWYPGIALEINYPAWSISVELFFYLLFPFLLQFFKKYSWFILVTSTFLFWVISSLQNLWLETFFADSKIYGIKHFLYYFPIWHLNTFLFGMLCGKTILNATIKIGLLQARLMYSVSFLVLVLILGTENSIGIHTHNGLLSPLYFLLILGIVSDESILTRFLSNPFFQFMGNASFGLYLLQYSVFILFSYYSGSILLNTKEFYVYLIFLLIVSASFYLFVDRTIGKWLK